MKTRAILIAAALLAVTEPVFAACPERVTAQGRAPHGANFDPPRKYDTEAMARSSAITAWTSEVRIRCPGHFEDWSRASSKKIECEGYAGGIQCTVSAAPLRR